MVDVAYFLAHRQIVRRIDTEEAHKVRSRAAAQFESKLTAAEVDDETGLPAWVAAMGIQPADGMPM